MNLLQFEQLVHQYQHRVYGFACYFLGNREDAADVTQEVLLRMWKHRADVDQERLLAWLLRVTRNACVDATRKRKAYQRVVSVDTDSLERACDTALSPEAATEASVFQEYVSEALQQLAEPYRSIVILREIQEMKYEEISGALNLPLNTVKVYLHRARKMLRKPLSKVVHREIV